MEDQQQNGMVTRDDLDLKVKNLNGDSQRSSRAWELKISKAKEYSTINLQVWIYNIVQGGMNVVESVKWTTFKVILPDQKVYRNMQSIIIFPQAVIIVMIRR